MGGAIPPIPQYAFMAWCSVKAPGQLYFGLLVLQDAGTPATVLYTPAEFFRI